MMIGGDAEREDVLTGYFVRLGLVQPSDQAADFGRFERLRLFNRQPVEQLLRKEKNATISFLSFIFHRWIVVAYSKQWHRRRRYIIVRAGLCGRAQPIAHDVHRAGILHPRAIVIISRTRQDLVYDL